MADNTKIEWARHPVTGRGASWNPLLARTVESGKVGYHCEHASPGCVNCYAESFNQRRLPTRGTGLSFHPGYRNIVSLFLDEKTLMDPIRWQDPRGIFVCSMTDLCGDFVDEILIDQMMAIMALAQQHVFMVLTKRSERLRKYQADPATPARIAYQLGVIGSQHPKLLERTARAAEALNRGEFPLRNVWLGVSVEDPRRAVERLPDLEATPAAVRFISAEPLLERVNLERWLPSVKWVIAGFESGTAARVVGDAPDIARSLRDQCAAAAVAFHFKQWGSWAFAPDGMNYADALNWGERQRYSLSRRSEAWGGTGGRPSRFQQFSNGRTAFYVGKKDAGRLLDGVEHNAMPGVR